MSNLALHVQSMEANLDQIGRHVTGFPSEDATLAGWLNLVTEGLTTLSEAALSPHDLHQSDFRALVHLFSSADGCAFPGELSACLRQTPANMTRIGNLLVARGLVARTHSTEDRRRVELKITRAGRAFVLALLPRFFPPLRDAFSCLSASEKRTLRELLERLVRAIDGVAAA
ncbi:MAG: MarR family transcriptional regulator [Burkholderiaceae bacterium]|jgi:MarR family transcriptional repressor of emrRAB|nr:MAG: MarR family transcriptional regulator [Burkholderiaceae bacterium]